MCLHELLQVSEVLERADDMDALLRLLPKEICNTLGFERAVFASSYNGLIKVTSAYFADRPEQARHLEQRAPELYVNRNGTLCEMAQNRLSIRKMSVADGSSDEQACREWVGMPFCTVIPVGAEGQLYGVLFAGFGSMDVTNVDDVTEACVMFSRLAAGAISNLRLKDAAGQAVERARQRVVELTLLQEVSSMLRAGNSVFDVLSTLIDEIRNVIDYDRASAAVYDPDERIWETVYRGDEDPQAHQYEQQIREFSVEAINGMCPVVAGGLDDSDPLFKLRLHGCASHMCIPMTAGDLTIGFLMLGSTRSDFFSGTDMRVAATIAGTAAASVEKVRIYSRAVRSEERMRSAFAQIGIALSTGMDVEQTLRTIASLAAGIVDADGASVMVLAPDHSEFTVIAETGLDEGYKAGDKLPAWKILARHVITDAKPVIFEDVTGTEAQVPALAGGVKVSSVISVPINPFETTQGVVEVYSHKLGAFDHRDLELMSWFAGQATVAIRNARVSAHDRNIARVFETNILDVVSPDFPGYDIAHKYQAALEEAAVGGDFIDFIRLDNDRLGVVVGDVSGKGLRAAVYATMAKYMLRAYAVEDPSPASMLSKLNDALVKYLNSSVFLTLFYAVIDSRTHTVTYSSAGHEPALRSCNERTTKLDRRHGGVALGITPSAKYTQGSFETPPGCSLLVYTDGITEASRGGQLLGVNKLANIFKKSNGMTALQTVESIYGAVLDYTGGRLRDDTVLLVIKRGPGDPLQSV